MILLYIHRESDSVTTSAEFRDDLADFVTREIIDAVTMFGRNEFGQCDLLRVVVDNHRLNQRNRF